MSAKVISLPQPISNSDIPPTFYDKVSDNLIMDLEKLIRAVTERYKLLKEVYNISSYEFMDESEILNFNNYDY